MNASGAAPKLAASVAVFRDGQVLVARRARGPAHGLWSLPGGAVEPGESPAEAAARELLEETGVEAEIVGFAGSREVVGGAHPSYLILAFAGRWRAGEAKPGAEATEVRWVKPQALTRLETTDGLPEIVAAARRLIEA